ncbi:MAG: DMT family transporter [Candidatus Pelagibacter sp. TMED106]|jgi:drug/metabolite transporter (DMT)-like permease|nr:MAG: DMT family transporter [Candidatus Pelagibacter sp. TMED106]|tara:strand:- start:196 stop:1089 length:894 start_codon:yes stop_codon:yes gene_type:complete
MQNSKAYIMLVCATLFWSGNFVIGKFAFLINIPPLSLVFYRWLLVWLLLLPFTFKEILKYKDTILDNLPLLFFLGFTSVGLFNSFTYLSLIHTQVINATLFNTAIPAVIILLCFLFNVEKTNKFQILGLIISVLGILSIITKFDTEILLSLNFNKGDIIMIGGALSWGVYSTLLKKKKFTLPLLTLVHVICTFGLICVFPQFLYEFSQGQLIKIDINLFYILIFLALFPSIGSYYCWAGAVSIIGANRAGIFLSLIPLFSTFFAIIFFNEKFEFYHLIGSILIMLGLLLSNKKIENA